LSDQLDEKFKIFQELVKQPENAKLKEEIMVGIQEAFDDSETGIIMGTEDFDQVGHYATYDAVESMTEILKRLGVAKEDVTVILNYRTPRLDQWISIWKHDDNPSYRSFMCDSQDDDVLRNERIQSLATQMDPLFAARSFLKEGWTVKLIDMGGVIKANLDIVNVIACDILQGKCLLDDEIVYGHRGDDTHFNVVDRDFQELTQEQIEEAEKLFRARDCAFQDLVGNNPKFEVGYADTIWNDCHAQDLDRDETYLYLDGNPEVLYSALLNQLNCSEEVDGGLTIEEALDGDHLAITIPDSTGVDSAGISAFIQESHSGGVNFALVVLLPFLLIAGGGAFFMSRIGRRKRTTNEVYRDQFQDRRGLSVTEMSEVFTDDDWKMKVDDDDDIGLFSKRRGNQNSLSLTI
jgi:hypothetical protein